MHLRTPSHAAVQLIASALPAIDALTRSVARRPGQASGVSVGHRRSAAWRHAFGVLFLFLLAWPQSAWAQASGWQTATVRYEGNGRDGYEWATYSMRYGFWACSDGKVVVGAEFVRGSLDVSPGYMYEGQRVEAPSGTAPRGVDQGDFESQVVRRSAGTTIGSARGTASSLPSRGCWSANTVPTTIDYRSHLGSKPSEHQIRSFVEDLELSVASRPPYRNLALESSIRAEARKRQHDVERSEAERVAAQEAEAAKAKAKAEAERVAAEKAEAERLKAERLEQEGNDIEKEAATSSASGGPATPEDEATTPESDTSVAETSVDASASAAPSSAAEATSPTPSGADVWRQYQANEAAREERAAASAQQFAEGLSGLAAQMMRQQAENDAREERRAQAAREDWQARCASLSPTTIIDPSYFAQPGRWFSYASGHCWLGQYSEYSWEPRDVYAFELQDETPLRFILAGRSGARMALRTAIDGPNLADGTQFARTLDAGKYYLITEAGEPQEEEDWATPGAHYLRVMAEDRCWVDHAEPIGVGHNALRPAPQPCKGPSGNAAAMYRLDKPSGSTYRRLSFELTGATVVPSMTVLAGDEGRLLSVEYQTHGSTRAVHLDDARPENHYVLVETEESVGVDDLDLMVQSSAKYIRPKYRGDGWMGLGYAEVAQGGSSAWVMKLGFSLGAQLHQWFGLTGVAEGAVGYAHRDSEAQALLSALLGPGGHLGRADRFIRVAPAASMVYWTAESPSFGPAVRVDAVTSLHPDWINGIGLSCEAHLHARERLYSCSLNLINLPDRIIPSPDDQ